MSIFWFYHKILGPFIFNIQICSKYIAAARITLYHHLWIQVISESDAVLTIKLPQHQSATMTSTQEESSTRLFPAREERFANQDDAVLYPCRTSPVSSDMLKNPPAIYRGAPFWSWNGPLNADQLKRQLACLKQMGFGGAHIHARTGLASRYMGSEFLQCVESCVDAARHHHMLIWLYDEDRWPSGSAGGLVTKQATHRAKHLLFTCHPYGSGQPRRMVSTVLLGERSENGQLLARYSVKLNHNGTLASYKRLSENSIITTGEKIWYAYLETDTNHPWFNNQSYVDVLSRDAINCFIEKVHEPYKQHFGSEFAKHIPAIFTDEPQYSWLSTLPDPFSDIDVSIPFTADFTETFCQAYGSELLDRLPEIFWDQPDHLPNATRLAYMNHLTQRFADAFGGTLGGWCEKNKLKLTGHLMQEPTLESQTGSVGEAMRILSYFQLPGIDMLCDWQEHTTAKQAQSVVHQYGREGMTSELYGVTNWDFDFQGHLGQGNWQAALGVTVRVPHLTWMSMAGEAKRDYPASIGWQSPWYKEYPLVEDHFARINVLMTRGKPAVRIGVIHPIESYWMMNGPASTTSAARHELDHSFKWITETLLNSQLDFDFISESLLPGISPIPTEKTLTVGQMNYDAIVIPAMRTIRASTLDRIEAFADAGGIVIFTGRIPESVDAKCSDRAQKLAKRSLVTPLGKEELICALHIVRDIKVTDLNGGETTTILYHMRKDQQDRHIFFCNTDRKKSHDTIIRIRGNWIITQTDTATGEQKPLPAEQKEGWSQFYWPFTGCGSLLITLSPGHSAHQLGRFVPTQFTEITRLADEAQFSLSEPNVLLLDQAEWKINDQPWQAQEEILKLDNKIRHVLGMSPRNGDIPQPWTDNELAQILAKISLRYQIQCDVTAENVSLAIESPEDAEIWLDNKPISHNINGWWVDESLKQIMLGSLNAGRHELIVSRPYTRQTTSMESCYILGRFGVSVQGRRAKITAFPDALAFGDAAHQGLPFYTGNITYHSELNSDGTTPLYLQIPFFAAALLSVNVDGAPAGKITIDPYRVSLGVLPAGKHSIDMTAYGTRYNAFGALHNCDRTMTWFGPESWRTTGTNWAYAYQLKPMGILESPIVLQQVHHASA